MEGAPLCQEISIPGIEKTVELITQNVRSV